MFSLSFNLINGKAPLCGFEIGNKLILGNFLFINKRCTFSNVTRQNDKYFLWFNLINKHNYIHNIKKKRQLLNKCSKKYVHIQTNRNFSDYMNYFNRYYYIKNNIFMNKLYKIKNAKLGFTLILAVILFYLLNLINNDRMNIYNYKINNGKFSGNNINSSNILVKYIIKTFNDPKLEESLKNLIKRILVSIVKECNDESLVNWKLFLKNILKEFENEIGNGVTNILKTKFIQEWIYSTANEIVDYLNKTPEIVSKTSSLFSEAINHQIFTEDSKKWFDDFVKGYIVNNKEILNSFNQLLTNFFNTKETQNNINNIISQCLLNKNTKEYLNIAIWDVFKNYIIYPKYWFTGVNRQRNEFIKKEEKD
ncbi:hypothetical protein FG386_001575 [Cryptosporidium ryanae]|uniref:uncharacterized protein n=1 Tax=Cryptosporidium ryanae TaxID=515981 RepID=UPI00351A99BA|nr:hypothetical protein FG386_001575 [Cryptosporidium ryanae]